MGGQSKPKKSKLKFASVVVSIIIALLVSGAALFYFYPAPAFVKQKDKAVKIERCIYYGGFGYYEAPLFDDGFYTFYSADGEVMCTSGGISGKKENGLCSSKMCFSFYGR